MKIKKLLAVLLALVLVVGAAACGGGESSTPTPDTSTPVAPGGSTPEGSDPAADGLVPLDPDVALTGKIDTEGNTHKPPSADGFNISVCIASQPETIDPAHNTSVDGGSMIIHMFEGLMKYEDDGTGKALVVEGQAASYEKSEPNAEGHVTYTFHLREGIKWSDGKPVVAQDFLYGMQRLVNPKTAADYNSMLEMVLNAPDVMNQLKPKEDLGVKAIDEKTLEVTLSYDCAYFLEVMAFPAVYPVRQDVIEAYGEQWTFEPNTYISNGPMAMVEWTAGNNITMVPNEFYYDRDKVTPDSIKYRLMDDDNAILSGFRNGDLDYIQNIPVDEIPGLKASGDLKVNPYLGTYYVCFNNDAAPFDDPLVREAFSLVIDRNHIVDEITETGEIAANAFVPFGISDAEGPSGKEFREVGGAYFSPTADDYKANCDRARELMAEAGYPDGANFPVVEYIYNTNDRHKVIGEALQTMWQKELGVTVTLTNQEWGVFLQNRKNGDYQVARHGWIADFNDPLSFLDLFVTGGGNNNANFSNAEYDALIKEAQSTPDPVARMAAMHKAEAILYTNDAAISPIYFYTQKYLVSDRLQGMYYTPLGYYFFMNTTEKAA